LKPTDYYTGSEVKENKMIFACGMHEEEERYKSILD
jgi:hypothetical protein